MIMENENLIDLKCDLEFYSNGCSVDFCNAYNIEDDYYICDAIHDFCDGRLDTNWYNLCEWLKGNDGYVAEALQEFGMPKTKYGEPYIMGMIKQGQYLSYEQDLYKDLDNIIKLFAVNYLIDLDLENGYEIYEKIENDLKEINNNNKFSDIKNLIDTKRGEN